MQSGSHQCQKLRKVGQFFCCLIFFFFSSTGVDQALGSPPLCSREGYLSALQDHHNLLELAAV